MNSKFPSFFVVGAQKAGTTTLHNWLAQQPDVVLPKLKETHFFSDDERYQRGLGWYLNQFPKRKSAAIMGEVDPDYLFFRNAPVRIKKLVQFPKLIFVFRHPIERAYSHYMMSVRRGYETLPFSEALQIENERLQRGSKFISYHSYLRRGRYCEQLNRYMRFFPEASFLFLKFDDLFNGDTVCVTYRRLCSFIGINTELIEPDVSSKNNQASRPISTLLRDFIYGQSRLRKILGVFIPTDQLKLRIALLLDRLNRVPIQKQATNWKATVPSAYWDITNKEIVTLQTLTGLDLKDWVYEG